jgi:hypothetical protein
MTGIPPKITCFGGCESVNAITHLGLKPQAIG